MEYRNIVIRGQVPSQKNSKKIAYNSRTGKPFVITEARVKEWQELGKCKLKEVSPIAGQVRIEMGFYNKDMRKRDVDNMMTSVLDLLKNNGVVEDDNCFVVKKLSGEFMGVDKDNPRVEVFIETLDTA